MSGSGRTFELTVFCEGDSEVGFVTRVLSPHLRVFRVFATPIMWKVRGTDTGVCSWKLVEAALRKKAGTSRHHQYFTMMLDYYRFQHDFDVPSDAPPAEKVTALEGLMHDRIASPRFVPYLQLHEFEALLYSDLSELPASFPDEYPQVRKAVESLLSSVSRVAPEDIDDRPSTAPSKRLIRAVPQYETLKSVVGPQVLERIGMARIRERCPHFDRWVTGLEQIGASSAP